ncbi:MAG: hypothetical protein Q8Q42_01185 [Nanoarchaeota archaeon]|nr:hypothetical protein [Nanoarchaeota archaeon]
MDAEKELLRPVEDHEIKEKGRIRRFVWLLVGFLLILLIASYILSSFAARSIVSNKVSGSIVKSQFGDVVFIDNTYETIKELYHTNEKEFRACLIGKYHNGNYMINDVFLPKVHFQDYDKVISSPCPEGTLLDMHSHPQQHCIFSDVDINGFSPDDKNTLLTVMCNDNEFIFHKKKI